jgi:hypothetical protein
MANFGGRVADTETQDLNVRLPSGATFVVLIPPEKQYIEERVARYLADNHFVNVSDYQDLDRLVSFELFVYRWSLFLSRGSDYYGDEIDNRALASQIESYSTEVRLLKRALGVDKPARDKARGDDSVVNYLTKLRERAREFGVMRNKQFDKALELFQQLHALVGYYDRCDEVERRENHATLEDIFGWIRDVALPEFDEIDRSFRQNQQKQWVRGQ